MGSMGWPVPLKSPATLECSWVEGPLHRPGPLAGLGFDVCGLGGAHLLPAPFIHHPWPRTCRCPLYNDLSVLTMHEHRRCLGERAQLNTWPEVGSIVPAGSPVPPSWILASLTPLYTPVPTKGSLVSLATLTAGPRGSSHRVLGPSSPLLGPTPAQG